MTRTTVMAWVGTRADLFPLGPVLEALGRAGDLSLRLVVTAAVRPLLTQLELGATDVAVLTTELQVGGSEQSTSGSRAGAEFAGILAQEEPDALVVLGDRWELLFVVPPAVLLGVPVVHLHGGEVTEGAIDDRIRHAVSKLADLHCVSTEDAARRLRQLGEPADRIVVTGAPSLDRLVGTTPLSDDELAGLLGGPVGRPFALATYHPATAADEDPGLVTDALIRALAATTRTAVVTHPGLDAGREQIIIRLSAAAGGGDSDLRVVANLGADYPRVMAAADLVVGNSSSGILEAASLSVPVVDVGHRQLGRERGANVINVPAEQQAIEIGIRQALDPAFRALVRTVTNPYGDGRASARIVAVIRRAIASPVSQKPFVDLPVGAR